MLGLPFHYQNAQVPLVEAMGHDAGFSAANPMHVMHAAALQQQV